MAYVSVPKDLTAVKNKVAFNLTLRQIICIAAGAAIGLPFYFLTRNYIGTSWAATGMVLLMLPEFLFAMYEKDGLHFEQILMNFISVRFLRPSVRRYETKNLYEMDVSAVAKSAAAGRKQPGKIQPVKNAKGGGKRVKKKRQ
ncbi:MAG: PrgI family protein [Clostridiales bacterium]|nr:PrgI family protein [Clostridiales bacterium]